MMKKLLFILSALLPSVTVAEDIDLYIGSAASRAATKPQVLLIFDNSGSMGNNVNIKTPYDKSINYPAVGFSALSGNHIYYVKGDASVKPVADDPAEKRRFSVDINSCKTARDRLDNLGFYTGYVREYTFSGNSGSWSELNELDGTSIKIIDCWDDIRLADNTNIATDADGNPVTPGYPIDGLGLPSTPVYYTGSTGSSNTDFGTGEVVTLFTDNYLRWHANNGLGTVSESKMDIAKYSVTSLIDSAPTVDFGLEIFNHNHGDSGSRDGFADGGRIVFSLQDLTPSKTSTLKQMINDLIPTTWTPLCESVYEAYRYLAGGAVHFGDDDKDHGTSSHYRKNDHPGQDMTAQVSGTYQSPYKTCSNEVSIILITDGAPTNDHSADGAISALPGIGARHSYDNQYLPALAEWMKTNDINPNMDGTQTASLYTIGFNLGGSTAVQMLKDAADGGGGEYYDASDPSSLLSKLQAALTSILKKDTSFTAPSVPSNIFNRSETLDSVYYAMFSPDRGPRWQGNLKKLSIAGAGIVDRTGASAIDASNGNIQVGAKTFWSTSATADGGEVSKGGVAEMLRNMAPSSRKVYSDIGTSGALAPLNYANASSSFGGAAAIATAMGVNQSDAEEYLKWAIGVDVDDADGDLDKTDMRRDVFGDPLHSKPVVINYNKATSDIRVFIGTNAGAVHMFKDAGNTVTEDWAFMPKEFFPNIKDLRENYTSVRKIYGVDGTPVSYINDGNADGVISGSGEALLFFGLRRGGSSYYALDVSDSAAPKLLWHKNKSSAGFNKMGQSWSTPKVTFSKINSSGGVPKPVIIFGAGYSTGKDVSGIGAADSEGKGVFMLDALTGNILWSLTDATSPSFPGTDSVPSSIATLDSDADGYTDRIYFGDTGGNVWRVDMPGTDTSKWLPTKLASLGSETVKADDRRFFAEPSIARAIFTETFEHTETTNGVSTTTVHHTETPFDAILIGSGDRTRPTNSSTNDKLFMIKDKDILTQVFTTTPVPIEVADLKDFTNDPFKGLTKNSPAYNAEAIDLSLKKGWYVDLSGSEEKNFAKPEAVAGVAYYNTFTPSAGSSNTCAVGSGVSQLYALNLEYGTKVYTKRVMEIGSTIQDGITLISIPQPPADPNNPTPTNQADGKPLAIIAGTALPLCDANGQNCGNLQMATMRSHLVVTER